MQRELPTKEGEGLFFAQNLTFTIPPSRQAVPPPLHKGGKGVRYFRALRGRQIDLSPSLVASCFTSVSTL